MTLETTIVLPIFILIFLAIYGIFGVVSAENQISHAFNQATKSMSMDPFLIERTDLAFEDKSRLWGSLKDVAVSAIRVHYDEHFMEKSDWFSTENMDDEDKLPDGSYDLSSKKQVAQNRFVGFFADGNQIQADERLRKLGVVDGLEGLDFTMSQADGNLTITVKYKLRFVFNFFDTVQIPMTHKLNVKLWS